MAANVLFLLLAFLVSMAGGLAALLIWRRYIQEPEQQQPPPQQLTPETQATIKTDLMTVQDWINWNAWYLEDEALRLEAQSIHLMRQRTHPDEPLEDNLERVAAEMRRRYADLPPTLN